MPNLVVFLFNQLTIESCCVFLPLHHVTLPAEPSMNIPENLHQAFHAHLLPDTLVLCSPRVHASSADAPHYGAGALEIPMQAHAFSHSVGGRSRVPFLFSFDNYLHIYLDMTVRILVDNELTSEIPYNNGVKQGCILAPTLFAIFAAAMCMHAFSDSPSGVSIRFRSNGSLCNLAHLRSQSKCMTTLLHEFQYADDCALIADSEEALQDTIDSFADAASSFDLTINCKKTEVMALQNSVVRNPLSVNGTHVANVHSFKYLGSTVTDDCRLDQELDCRIQCATTSFGWLWDRLWSSHDISNKTKISVYTAAITSALLFGAETWTLYQRHFVRLQHVQQRHLRAILRVPYTDRITNDQILDRAGVPDIEMFVRKMQLRWAGHVARMSDDRIPKQLLFGKLTTGIRTVGHPLLRWKDSLKDTLKQSNISTMQWQDIATDRSTWRRSVHDRLMLYDNSRRERNATKRARQHAAQNATTTASQDAYMCRHCGRICSSRIGILSHERACQKQRGRDT